MNRIKPWLFAITMSLVPMGAFAGVSTNKPTNSVSIIKPQQNNQPIIIARSSFDSELLRLTNAERRKVGLQPLRYSATLGRVAQSHAKDMIKNNYFDHTGLNGSQPSDRAKSAGYSYSYVGENIAAGNKTPAETIRQWMNSPGHRANILNRNYTEIGFGYTRASTYQYEHVWVQVFGTPSRNARR